VLGAILLVFAGTYYALAAVIPESQLADTVGPGGLPKAYAVLLAALSTLVIVRARSGRLAPPPTGAAPTHVVPHARARVAGMLGIGVLYVAVVPWIGYVAALAGVMVGTALCQGSGLNRRVLIVGTAGAGVMWLLFVRLLGIPQPPGIWPSPW
jgi:hypothetical protein